MKTCTKCNQDKDNQAFPKDKSKRDGLHSYCKDCHRACNRAARLDPDRVQRMREVSRLWRVNNPERSAAGIRCATLRKKYGITAEEYEQLFDAQGRVCAICGDPYSKGNGRLHVDHDHVTGKIRGILCQACNVTLGKMRDSPTLLRLAADYLER